MVGIGIFILAVAFVFAFLPTIITPFDTSTGGAETAQADRIADRVVEDVSTAYSERPNEIVRDEFEDYTDKASHELAADWGLRSSEADDIAYDQVNVSIQHLEDTDGEPVDGPDGTLAAGDEYDGQAAASAARIVTVVDGDGPLESDVPAYRLVVRVW
ncbi:hypothetical protein C446_03791 [Halobiforma nitratireducens JCM 10879]|uniref:Pilin/flagellin n=1 Tax=Halobiforma nitratireducens JCM 10879 TaxID=1227454 RepID=M0MC76_9EURY|nr:hypothetical protein C446_03791 [Halobiforma nitratireducens JCM 10879]